ncbi:MAG: hypothetical protein KAH23_07005, partial [Kiritimatiellae bacterium]|nr:hypothetical protein [Kiritimatiellia bacterium]
HIQKHLTLLLMLLLCGTAVSYARVFMRKSSASNSNLSMKALHGKSIYEAPVTINGGQGNLTIFSFDRNMKIVLTDMKKTFDIQNMDATEGTLATATVKEGNTALRFVAIRPSRGEQNLVFKLEQSSADAALTKNAPRQHLLKRIPHYPDSTPVFYMKDDNTYASISVSTTDSPPEVVSEYFASRLTSSGWLQPLNLESEQSIPINSHGMQVYIKNKQICCIAASTTPSGTTTITLLHKTQRME